MMPVENIERGQCFRKKNGKFAYIRISDDAVRHFGLKYETHVYGVCYNGNMTEVKHGTLVERVDVSVMDENRANEEAWNAMFSLPDEKDTQ